MLVVRLRYVLLILLLIPIFFFPFVLNSSIIVIFLFSCIGSAGLGYEIIDYYFILSKKYNHYFLNKKIMPMSVFTKNGKKTVESTQLRKLYRFKIAHKIQKNIIIRICCFFSFYYGVPAFLYFFN